MSNLEDLVAIRTLIETYCDAVNQRNIDLYSALWCDDATWVLNDNAISGKDAILETWTTAMSHFDYVFFMSMPGVINIIEPVANARIYVNEHVISQDGVERYIDGLYEDELRKEQDGWKFLKRHYQIVRENRV